MDRLMRLARDNEFVLRSKLRNFKNTTGKLIGVFLGDHDDSIVIVSECGTLYYAEWYEHSLKLGDIVSFENNVVNTAEWINLEESA